MIFCRYMMMNKIEWLTATPFIISCCFWPHFTSWWLWPTGISKYSSFFVLYRPNWGSVHEANLSSAKYSIIKMLIDTVKRWLPALSTGIRMIPALVSEKFVLLLLLWNWSSKTLQQSLDPVLGSGHENCQSLKLWKIIKHKGMILS